MAAAIKVSSRKNVRLKDETETWGLWKWQLSLSLTMETKTHARTHAHTHMQPLSISDSQFLPALTILRHLNTHTHALFHLSWSCVWLDCNNTHAHMHTYFATISCKHTHYLSLFLLPKDSNTLYPIFPKQSSSISHYLCTHFTSRFNTHTITQTHKLTLMQTQCHHAHSHTNTLTLLF